MRAGAGLSEAEKDRLKAYNAELASLQTTFSQNVLAEVNAKAIVVDRQRNWPACATAEIAAAAEAAKSRGLEGKYVLPLLNTSGQPSLGALENRALRERIHTTSLGRGSAAANSTTAKY